MPRPRCLLRLRLRRLIRIERDLRVPADEWRRTRPSAGSPATCPALAVDRGSVGTPAARGQRLELGERVGQISRHRAAFQSVSGLRAGRTEGVDPVPRGFSRADHGTCARFSARSPTRKPISAFALELRLSKDGRRGHDRETDRGGHDDMTDRGRPGRDSPERGTIPLDGTAWHVSPQGLLTNTILLQSWENAGSRLNRRALRWVINVPPCSSAERTTTS